MDRAHGQRLSQYTFKTTVFPRWTGGLLGERLRWAPSVHQDADAQPGCVEINLVPSFRWGVEISMLANLDDLN